MPHLTVEMPEPMERWVEERVRSGPFDGPADYLRDLIRRDQERARKIAAMQQAVTEGLESGEGSQSMEELRQTARARIATLPKAKGHGV